MTDAREQPRYAVSATAPCASRTFYSHADNEDAALEDARAQLADFLNELVLNNPQSGDYWPSSVDAYQLKIDGIIYGAPPFNMPVEVDLFRAQGIRPESWLHAPRFDDFRAGYEYAAGRTQALPGLTNVSAEEAYYLWKIITRGVMQYWEREHEEHHGDRIFVEACPHCAFPSDTTITGQEQP